MLVSLEHLLLAHEYGTFTEAARHAHLSQPAFSASIGRLEEAMGARLFDRGRHGASLTASGAALLPHARACLAALVDAERAVRAVEELETGHLELCAGATACAYLLPSVLSEFVDNHPGISLRLLEMSTQESIDAVREGTVDLAVVGRGTKKRDRCGYDGLTVERWITERLLLVKRIGQGTRDLPHLVLRQGGSMRLLFERTFVDEPIAMELGSVAAIKAHVSEGIGMALLSEHAVRRELARGEMELIDDRRVPIRREICLVHRGKHRLSPAAAALRKRLRGRRT